MFSNTLATMLLSIDPSKLNFQHIDDLIKVKQTFIDEPNSSKHNKQKILLYNKNKNNNNNNRKNRANHYIVQPQFRGKSH